ncbi:MAG: hypothetical protein NTX45_29260 [Proteobacteria bacterium]|nr:hypothetical protein [Pseudomonadota bacterium]
MLRHLNLAYPHSSVCHLAGQGTLTRRFGQLTVEGLSPSKTHRLAACPHAPARFGAEQCKALYSMRPD